MKKYIVPFDFQATGESALIFTKGLVEKGEAQIILLHIVKDEDEKKLAEAKFTEVIQTNGSEVKAKVVIGDLVNDLAEISTQLDGTAVIMAKRYEAGLQKVFGSRALKVNTDSDIPFLIIQEGQDYKPLKKIAITVDANSESTHIIRSVVDFCESHGSEVVIVGGIQDDKEIGMKIQKNIESLSKQLTNNRIKNETQLLPRKGFEVNLLEYAKAENVDMIASTYYKNNSALFSSNFVGHLLENKDGIPVLTIGGLEIPAFKKLMINMVCPISVEKIDSNVSRMTVFMNVVMMGIFLYTYHPVLAYIVAGDYFIRAVFKPLYSPFRFLSSLIVKGLSLKYKPINLAPKVYASRLGMLCAVGSVIFLLLNMYWASVIIMGLLMALSFADSVLNFCVGCMIYTYLVFPFYKYKVR